MENHAQTQAPHRTEHIQTTTKPVMHSFTENTSSTSPVKVLLLLLVVAVLGVGTGYGLSLFTQKTGERIPLLPQENSAAKGKIFGSDDTNTFKDTAEGTLKEGGVEGEGQYHLVRSGGESQNVYLTSSLVDLSQFVGKKIKVWGETQEAQNAGWLMDVGRVEIIE